MCFSARKMLTCVLQSRSMILYGNKYIARRRVYARSLKRDDYNNAYEHKCQIFQTNPPLSSHIVHIEDVEDALQATRGIPQSDRCDYFAAHGIDYERAVKYIQTVKYLNRCYYNADRNHKGGITEVHYPMLCCMFLILSACITIDHELVKAFLTHIMQMS